MHRIIIFLWLCAGAIAWAWTDAPILFTWLALAGAAGAWSLSLVQRFFGEPDL